MATTERRRSVSSLLGKASRDDSLAAPVYPSRSKGAESSTVSVASSDTPSDVLRKSTDASRERLKSRNSDDGRSDTSSPHRMRMSRMFKGRGRRIKTGSQSDLSYVDSSEDIPPVPDVPLSQSTDSLGLAKSVPSSLLTEDSDYEA